MRSETGVGSPGSRTGAVARRTLRLAAAIALLVLPARGAGAQVQLTSLEGEARLEGAPLSLHAAVVEGRLLELGSGTRCTLLLADHTLVRICGRAALSVTAAGSSRPGDIELREGTLYVVALPESQEGAFRIQTPAATVLLLGGGVHVQVAPDGGDTLVSTLASPVRVATRRGEAAVRIEPGQQLRLRAGQQPGEPHPLDRERLARSSPCLQPGDELERTLRTERALLATGLPLVSAGEVDATPTAPVDDLMDIVRQDFPSAGLPLQAPGAPSALVSELSKRGMNEEVCDPINCNPVYQVEPPGACGVPPERGCIP